MTNTHILVHEFDYLEPASLAEAISLLAESDGRAQVLAGGTNLLVWIKLEQRAPERNLPEAASGERRDAPCSGVPPERAVAELAQGAAGEARTRHWGATTAPERGMRSAFWPFWAPPGAHPCPTRTQSPAITGAWLFGEALAHGAAPLPRGGPTWVNPDVAFRLAVAPRKHAIFFVEHQRGGAALDFTAGVLDDALHRLRTGGSSP